MSLDHLGLLAAAQSAFADLLATADPEAPVPCCEPWHVADLALHLGGVHWWAAAMAMGVDLDPHDPADPRDPAALVEFYTWAAGQLRDSLAALPPDAPALTLDGPGTAAFWRRRQLHETLVHLDDLAAATGTDGADLGERHGLAGAWWDTVDEVLEVLLPRQVRLGRTAPPADTIELTDGAGTVRRLGTDDPVAVVRAQPRELALLLWHRRAPGDLEVSGDRDAVDRVLALRLTP